MRYLAGSLALLIACATAFLAYTVGPHAFAPPSEAGLPPGQIRGILFTLVMVASTGSLLWMAANLFRRPGAR